MRGFWVTARTSSPSRVLFRMNQEEAKEKQRQNKDRDTDIADLDDLIDHPAHPSSQREMSAGGPACQRCFWRVCCSAMEIPNVARQRLQRPVIEPADDQPFHRDACGEGDREGQRQGDDQR